MNTKTMTRMMTGMALGAATLLGAGEANATVAEPDPALSLLPASPGIFTAVGALITTVGTSASLADTEAVPYGWSATAIVFGSLSTVSGAIYTALAAETKKNDQNRIYAPTAATNFSLGASALVTGIVAVALRPAAPEHPPAIPALTIDATGASISLSGSF